MSRAEWQAQPGVYAASQPANKWEASIAWLERHDLDQCEERGVTVATAAPLGVLEWLRIQGTQRPWSEPPAASASRSDEEFLQQVYPMEDVLAGLAGQQRPCAFLVAGEADRIHFFLGTSPAGQARSAAGQTTGKPGLQALLQSAYPHLETYAVTPQIVSALTAAPRLTHAGLVCGIPTPKPAAASEGLTQIDRLCRGLYGAFWGLLVLARPVGGPDVTRENSAILGQLQEIQAKEDLAKNPRAAYCVELLRKQLAHLKLGRILGMWQAAAMFFAGEAETFERARAILRASLGGDQSVPTPVRAFPAANLQRFLADGQLPDSAHTATNPPVAVAVTMPLNSRRLAALVHVPLKEMPGFRVRRAAEFAVDCRPPVGKSIRVGTVLERGESTGNAYGLRTVDLTKHALVIGVTGSGKTNTTFSLLQQLWQEHQVPFLVIEPAKAEYRNLVTSPHVQGRGQVFTLGDETVSPFRLNPFQVLPGIGIQTHLDLLKSVFNASFVLYPPMPYVLERCLHEVYLDKGWDLVTNRNRRLPEAAQAGQPGCPPEVFPTLGDLYDKIEPVVRSYRYDPKIAMDVTAGLKARIGSLRIGGKGLMLDTRQSVPWAQLLGRPTVLELEGVGDDEEKAFIIALLLMVLYEYRRTQSSQPSLQHVTVVEEAHRLLKRTSTDSGSSESANPAGKAVESFANMLAEIRSYGQGFLIADQIPNKLAVEVIKNTNLKILHRVVAEDDRQVMGGAMNLDGEQLRDVSTLTVGRALIYAEGMVSPYLVQVDFDKSKQVAAPATRAASDQAVQTLMQGFRKARVYDRFTACAQCPVRCDPAICDLAEDLLEAEGQSQAANGYVFGAVFDGEAAIRGYFQLQRRMERLAGRQLSADRLPILMHCLLVHAVDLWIERRGAHYRWLFPAGGELKQRLTALLVRLARDLRNDAATVQRMKTEVVPHLERLRGTIEQLCAVATGPFAGCSECQHRCWFAPEVAELARDDALHRIYDRALDADDPIPAVRRAAETAAAQLVPAAGLRDALARCFVVQKLQSRRAPDAAQLVRTIFEEKKKRKAGSS